MAIFIFLDCGFFVVVMIQQLVAPVDSFCSLGFGKKFVSASSSVGQHLLDYSSSFHSMSFIDLGLQKIIN